MLRPAAGWVGIGCCLCCKVLVPAASAPTVCQRGAEDDEDGGDGAVAQHAQHVRDQRQGSPLAGERVAEQRAAQRRRAAHGHGQQDGQQGRGGGLAPHVAGHRAIVDLGVAS